MCAFVLCILEFKKDQAGVLKILAQARPCLDIDVITSSRRVNKCKCQCKYVASSQVHFLRLIYEPINWEMLLKSLN